MRFPIAIISFFFPVFLDANNSREEITDDSVSKDFEVLKVEIEESMLKGLKERDPLKEFEERKTNNEILFYCYGSLMYGYSLPGLSKEQVEKYINSKKFDMENQFQTDPIPVFYPDKYLELLIEFIEEYNKIVLEYIEGPNKSLEVTPLADARVAPQL
ncbi:MAG: hypothetical protein AB3N10_03475 [Allomuricauda sp.]